MLNPTPFSVLKELLKNRQPNSQPRANLLIFMLPGNVLLDCLQCVPISFWKKWLITTLGSVLVKIGCQYFNIDKVYFLHMRQPQARPTSGWGKDLEEHMVVQTPQTTTWPHLLAKETGECSPCAQEEEEMGLFLMKTLPVSATGSKSYILNTVISKENNLTCSHRWWDYRWVSLFPILHSNVMRF